MKRFLSSLIIGAALLAGAPPSNVNEDTTTVYRTQHGQRYHMKDCQILKRSTTVEDVSITEAKAKGLTACGFCWTRKPKATETQKGDK